MKNHSIDITSMNMEDIYGVLPQLRDEIELARLCRVFAYGDENGDNSFFLLSDLLAENDYERVDRTNYDSFLDIQDLDLEVDERLNQCYLSLSDTFDKICEIMTTYYPEAKPEKIYRVVLEYTDIWEDLYYLTYELMIECIDTNHPADIDKSRPSAREGRAVFERHLVYNSDGTKLMTMVVNLVPVVVSPRSEVERQPLVRTESAIAAEHIYIAKCTSALIMQFINSTKSRTFGNKNNNNNLSQSMSYKLHNYALKKFKPTFMYSNPLKSIDAVFKQLENDNKIAMVWDKSRNSPKEMPFKLEHKVCEDPFYIYFVIPKKNRGTRRGSVESSPSSAYSRRKT